MLREQCDADNGNRVIVGKKKVTTTTVRISKLS